MKKFIKVILNILTCSTLLLGLMVVSFSSSTKTPITSGESLYFGLQSIWKLLLFLPITIGNIAYSIYLKKSKLSYKSSFVLGIVFSSLLLAYGSMHFLSKGLYSEDKSYLYNLEEQINIDFPDNFTIVTEDWSKGKQTSSYDIYLKSISVVRFEDNTDVYFDNNWINNIDNHRDDVPIIFYLETTNYEKFLIYCFDTKEFNPDIFNNNYEYIAIGYDVENNNLLIYEYYFSK